MCLGGGVPRDGEVGVEGFVLEEKKAEEPEQTTCHSLVCSVLIRLFTIQRIQDITYEGGISKVPLI